MRVMSELHEECGVAAIYHLPGRGVSPLCPEQGPEEISRLMPRMLLDIQNRGQLASGITTYSSPSQPTHRHLQGRRQRQRGLPPEPPRQVREPDGRVRRPGGDRARPLRHLRPRRPQLRPALRAAPHQEAQVVQFRLQRPTGQLHGPLRGTARRRQQPSLARDRHGSHHAPDLRGPCRPIGGRR